LTSFVALYRGDTVSAAKIIAVSADPELVRGFAARMAAEPSEQESGAVLGDPERGGRCTVLPMRDEAGGE
jgi:hypothetical protein